MRFPLFADLDADQKRLYGKSPSDGAILVVGPPGSGKTVVAAHRTVRLSASGRPVVLIMFNKVLSQYTSNFDGFKSNTRVMHAHNFWPSWYRSAFGKQIPKIDQFTFDWPQIRSQIRDCKKPSILSELNWGHLIIDEGQDFEPEMYEALMSMVNHPNISEGERPTLSVFADDNQTISDRNSTIPELMEALNTSTHNQRLWRLDKNYRNSLEVAKFSKYFQVRGSTATKLPDRSSGRPPIVFMHTDVEQIYDQIARYTKNNSSKEIGVIVFGNKRDVTRCYNKVKNRIVSQKVNCTIQGYINAMKGKGITEVGDLAFDNPPTITVLHAQSAKGLEFDTLFVVNLNDAGAYDSFETDTYKKLYVVSSRSRDAVFLSIRGSLEESFYPEVMCLLPKPSDGLCHYLDQEGELIPAAKVEPNVEWKLSAYEFEKQMLSESKELEEILRVDRNRLVPILEELAVDSFDQMASATVINEKIFEDEGLMDVIVELGRERALDALLEAIQ